MRRALVAVGVALLLGAAPGPAHAQAGPGLTREARARVDRLLQEATRARTRGDYAGARSTLEEALAVDPASIGGVLLLEAVLTAQGDIEALLPHARALIGSGEHTQIGYQVLLRSLSALGRTDAMREEAEHWRAAAPDDAATYREIARIWEYGEDWDRSLDILRRGRDRLGRDDALALELGIVHARRGEVDRAVVELDRALGESAAALLLVRRWLAPLERAREVADGLSGRLLADPTTPARRNAAFELAVDAGLETRAREAALAAIGDGSANERARFLGEAARMAGAADLLELEYWAYRQLLEERPSAGRALAIRGRLAELALAMGDTARARADYLAIERASSAGSPQRRRAAAFAVELAARAGDVAVARESLSAFRAEYPEAPETDRLSAAVADAILASGDPSGALSASDGAAGPLVSMVRGRALLALGRTVEARVALTEAVADLSGIEATRAIALLSLLDRLSDDAVGLLATAIHELDRGRAGSAVDGLLEGAPAVSEEDAPALLDFAASVAERASLPARAEAARRTVIETYPRAPESAAALLALAEALGERPEGRLEARVLLERMILEHPRSALLPRARRLLGRLGADAART